MLSAAGARNIQSRVRNGGEQSKKHPARSSNLRSRKQVQVVAENADEVKENHAHGLRRSVSAAGSSKPPHHSNLKKKESNESSGHVEKYKSSREQQRPRRSVDRMKKRSTTKLPHHKPTIRLKAPRPLPFRGLFQHQPRTWFGSKKEKGNKVKELDWRNARPSAAVKKPSKKEESKQDCKKSSTIESHGKSSLEPQRPRSSMNHQEGAVKKSSKKGEHHHDKQSFKRSSTIESHGKSSLAHHHRPNNTHDQDTVKKSNKKEEHRDKQRQYLVCTDNLFGMW